MTDGVAGSFERLFRPHSIAVVGASRDESSVSGQPLANLRNHAYRGRLYPVNPRYNEVGGFDCHPSVAALPECPDLAIIVVGAKHVPGVVRECGERGVPFVLVVSSGFAETGDEGAALQREIDALARQFRIGVIGPNCQGMMNVTDGMYAGFGAAFQIPRLAAGPVSLVTQSGGFGYAVVSMAEEAGVGFRHVVCTGNESGITTLDFVEHFIADADTRIVAGYVEGLRDARRLLGIGDLALAASKPILIWKVGRSEVGQRAAISHTANLGGANELYKAAFRQRGILEVHDVQDLADLSRAFLAGREPRGNAVGIVTISGGAGIVMADACAELGLRTPALSAASARRLRELVPAFGSVENPVDVTGNLFNEPQTLVEVLRTVGEDENIDSLVVMIALVQGSLALRFASEVAALNRTLGKPIVLCWSARDALAREAYALIDAESIPRYPTPVRAVRALSGLLTFADAKRRYRARQLEKRFDSPPTPRAVATTAATNKATAGATTAATAAATIGATTEAAIEFAIDAAIAAAPLTEYQGKQLLARYGIRTTREQVARSRADAIRIAAEIGFPVVLKVSSGDIAHKTECNGVRVGLKSDLDVAHAFDEILSDARSFHPQARIDGVLVGEMIAGGVETIAGVINDPRFGPAIMFGLGGIFAEVLKDFAFRICPLDRQDAEEMIREIRGHPLLEGARGAPPADIPALVDALLRLSAMATELEGSIAELDINPLFVMPEGRGVIAADVLIRLRDPASHPLAAPAGDRGDAAATEALRQSIC